MTVIAAKGLTAAYGNGAAVLYGIDLQVEAGQHLGISGRSGAGKSTLLRILAGLSRFEHELQVSGQVTGFDGHDLLIKPYSAGQIGWITEEPKAGLHAQRTLAETWIRYGLPDQLNAWLSRLKVADPHRLMQRYPHQVSGGEAQRFRIAMALARRPRLLLMEGPTSSLDAVAAQEVMSIIGACVDEGMAVIHVSHDTALLDRYATHRLELESGRLRRVEQTAAPRNEPRPIARHEPALVVRDLTATAESDRKTLVDQVSFGIDRGQAFGLAGRSGSGKTSLGLALARLLPATGCVEFCGSEKPYPLANRGYASPDRRIQYIWQESRAALNPSLSALAHVLPVAMLEHDKAESRVRIDALCEEVGFPRALLARSARTLSSGEMLRLTLVRALAAEPEILVCDELLATVDYETGARIVDTLQKFQLSQNLSLLWIGHDLQQMRTMCSMIGVMEGGRLVESSKPEDLMHSTESVTQALLGASLA